jgi:hypothetical protein
VMSWFLLRGLWPATPAESRPYDLLLDTPGGVKRVQVKTTTCTASSASWQVGIGRHSGGGDRHNRKVPYSADEVDLFAIVDGDFSLYLIPIAAVAGRTTICLDLYRQFVVGSAVSLSARAPRHIESSRRRAVVTFSDIVPEIPGASYGQTKEHGADRHRQSARWTESELRAAAESSTSWADLLRLFGYQPSSTAVRQALRRELRRYEIDTSHFVGQRTWSDQALVEAAASAKTWADLLAALGLSTSSRSCASVRTALRRLGVVLDQITLGPKVGPEATGIDLPDRPALARLRNAAPCIAATWFVLCGQPVAIPCEAEPYDLVVDLPDGLKRLQVKTTTARDARGGWIARIGHRPDGSPKTADLVCYAADEADLFLVIDGDLRLYLIPRSAVAGKTNLSLRGYSEFVVADASSLMGSIHPTLARRAPSERTAS